MTNETQPGGVAGRIIQQLNSNRFDDDVDDPDESTLLDGYWVGAVHLHAELSREARAILAEWEDPAVEAQRSLLEQTFTDLGLNLTEEESHE